jgi:hypothetical protein
MSMIHSPLTKLFVYPAWGMPIAPLISSCQPGKAFHCTEADDRIAWEATSHSMLAGWQFPWEELPRNPSKVDVLDWYIEITDEKNLSLVNIIKFPMVVDHRSFTVHTSMCNMWSPYIDKLKAEVNKGKKNRWILYGQGVYPLSIIYSASIWMVVMMWNHMPHGRERGQG